MKCPNCGAEIRDDALYCPECGGNTTVPGSTGANGANPNGAQQGYEQRYEQGMQQQGMQQGGMQYNAAPMQIPEEYTPISMWGYFGYQLLFSIPVIGLIFLCIYAFGGTKNMNLKNFARSYFCMLIIVVILLIIIISCGVAGGLLSGLN